MNLEQIGKSEMESHTEIYAQKELYEEGSWLQKPIKTVTDIIPLFAEHKELRVLDLGGVVGRNCIPFAMEYGNIPCTMECVDILEFAIEKLNENAKKYGVSDSVKGIVETIEGYVIKRNTYDLIMAISALEHIDSEKSFVQK